MFSYATLTATQFLTLKIHFIKIDITIVIVKK